MFNLYIIKFDVILTLFNWQQAALAMSWKEMEEEDDQEALNKAIMQSLESSSRPMEAGAPESLGVGIDDDDLKRAISLSLSGGGAAEPTASTSSESASPGAIADSIEFIRQRRLLRLGQLSSPNTTTTNPWARVFLYFFLFWILLNMFFLP